MNQKIIKYSKNTIRLLCQSLDNGNIIAVPTDTVYGLIADAHNENAVNKIFKAKLSPKKLPLIIFVSSIEEAKKIGHFSKYDDIH
jgi:L-threonylcarbamoyladenylate synthase